MLAKEYKKLNMESICNQFRHINKFHSNQGSQINFLIFPFSLLLWRSPEPIPTHGCWVRDGLRESPTPNHRQPPPVGGHQLPPWWSPLGSGRRRPSPSHNFFFFWTPLYLGALGDRFNPLQVESTLIYYSDI